MDKTLKIPPGTKVFIVEDDSFISSLLTKRFQSIEVIVSSVDNGNIATENIKKTKPDIVLLDIMLPGTDGLQILQQLKADPDTKNIPVIILSNLGEKAEIEKAKKYGAASFLIKATLSVDEIVAEVAKKLIVETITRG